MQHGLLTTEGELSTGRDFDVYVKGMDAGMELKLRDIVPHIKPGLIADKGCANGTLLTHLSKLFGGSQLVGIDLSEALLAQARERSYENNNVSFVRGNIITHTFARGTVDTEIFSSIFHEVHSYTGYNRDSIRRTLDTTREELVELGRLVLRDGISPITNGYDEISMNRRKTWMRCDKETLELFYRFAGDFRGLSDHPGVPFIERKFDGDTYIHLSLHQAAEFMSKKDYHENWKVEVNEEFGAFGYNSWRRVLAAAGFRILEEDSYCNPWVRSNRYIGKVALFGIARDGGPGWRLPFPKTTIKIAAEAI